MCKVNSKMASYINSLKVQQSRSLCGNSSDNSRQRVKLIKNLLPKFKSFFRVKTLSQAFLQRYFIDANLLADISVKLLQEPLNVK